MKGLCQVCQQLDLWKLNNRQPREYSLGKWGDVKTRALKCPFCNLVLCSSPRQAVWDTPAMVEWKKEGGFFTNNMSEYIAFLGAATSPHGAARELKPQIDPALIKKWIRICEWKHNDTCSPKTGIVRAPNYPSGLQVFRVIDVIDHCLVNATPGVRYIPLSYVWGPNFKPRVDLQRENVKQLYTKGYFRKEVSKIPLTIKDAMALVGKIGERYLWMDSLCLIQNNPSDLLAGISKNGPGISMRGLHSRCCKRHGWE